MGSIQTPSDAPELLELIEDPVSRKMIATWPNVGLIKQSRAKMVKRWAQIAQLRELEVEAAWDKLFVNGFCKMDGTVDETARDFVRSRQLRILGKRRRRKESKPAEPPPDPPTP